MTEASKDTKRALRAARSILDGRDPQADFAAILVTLDHVIGTVLLVTMGGPEKAVRMLHEGTIPGVEERIAMVAAKRAAR